MEIPPHTHTPLLAGNRDGVLETCRPLTTRLPSKITVKHAAFLWVGQGAEPHFILISQPYTPSTAHLGRALAVRGPSMTHLPASVSVLHAWKFTSEAPPGWSLCICSGALSLQHEESGQWGQTQGRPIFELPGLGHVSRCTQVAALRIAGVRTHMDKPQGAKATHQTKGSI